MNENENQNSEIINEVAPQVETNVSEAKETQEIQEPVNNQHLKAMRIKNDELKREIRELKEMQMEMMKAQLSNQHVPEKQEVDEFANLSDDEFIPLGKVKKLTEKSNQRVMKSAEELIEKAVEKRLKKINDEQFMDRLNRQYSDFSDVVNPETLSILEETEPELAATIAELKDPYKIGVQSYKYIKALKLSEKAPQARREKELDKAIEKQEKAVQSPMAYDKRPIAQAFKLTDAMKKDLYREMHGYAALAGSVPEMS